MRITKKTIREAKSSMLRRMRELVYMDDAQITTEHKRCFPHLPDDQRLESVRSQRWDLLSDLVELAFPAHWCD